MATTGMAMSGEGVHAVDLQEIRRLDYALARMTRMHAESDAEVERLRSVLDAAADQITEIHGAEATFEDAGLASLVATLRDGRFPLPPALPSFTTMTVPPGKAATQ